MQLEILDLILWHRRESYHTHLRTRSERHWAVHMVRMYSRPGCGLCDEARTILLAERERTPFAFEEVDVSGEDALELEYGIRIPVVEVDGEEAFEVTVDAAQLARLLGPDAQPRS